jgi:hypothetical protein
MGCIPRKCQLGARGGEVESTFASFHFNASHTRSAANLQSLLFLPTLAKIEIWM